MRKFQAESSDSMAMKLGLRTFMFLCAMVSWSILPSLSLGLAAEELLHEQAGWALNIPETWAVHSVGKDLMDVHISDQQGYALIQVIADSEPFDDLEQTHQAYLEALKARTGEAGIARFGWDGHAVSLAEVLWESEEGERRGYLVLISRNGDPSSAVPGLPMPKPAAALPSYLILVSAPAQYFEDYHDFLISALDTFDPAAGASIRPGLISTFIGGLQDVDAAQALVEREARVLAHYQAAKEAQQLAAWRRFYQIIYKDNYARLEGVTKELQTLFDRERVSKADIPQRLLEYVQGFKYERPGGLSDLRAPLSAVTAKTGDCDARSLVYMALLQRFGISSVLMVSPVHAHSLVGVGVQGGGARFPYASTTWLVAETTDKVKIGLIAANMADPADWVGMDLRFTP